MKWRAIYALYILLFRRSISALSTVPATRNIFERDNVQRIQPTCIALGIGYDNRSLRQKNKIGVVNRVFMTTGCDNRKGPKRCFVHTLTDGFNVHTTDS